MSGVVGSRPSGQETAWELQAPGWPPHSKAVTFLGGIALTCAALLSLGGGALTYTLGASSWAVPPILPLLVVLALVQAYRVARWRSTAWGLSVDATHAIRVRGVFRRRLQRRVSAPEVAAEFFEGLTPDSAATLVEDCRAGRPPSRPIESAGSWRGLLGLLLLALVLTPAVEALAWGHRRYVAEFQRISAAARGAIATAQAQTEPLLLQRFAQRVRDEPSLSATQQAELLERGSYLDPAGSEHATSSSQLEGSLERWRVVIATLTVLPPDPTRPWWRGSDERVDLSLELVRPGWIPRPVRPLRIGRTAAPDNELFLDQLRPLLEAAQVPFELE